MGRHPKSEVKTISQTPKPIFPIFLDLLTAPGPKGRAGAGSVPANYATDPSAFSATALHHATRRSVFPTSFVAYVFTTVWRTSVLCRRAYAERMARRTLMHGSPNHILTVRRTESVYRNSVTRTDPKRILLDGEALPLAVSNAASCIVFVKPLSRVG